MKIWVYKQGDSSSTEWVFVLKVWILGDMSNPCFYYPKTIEEATNVVWIYTRPDFGITPKDAKILFVKPEFDIQFLCSDVGDLGYEFQALSETERSSFSEILLLKHKSRKRNDAPVKT